MTMFTGHTIIEGRPFINGKPAIWDEKPSLLPDAFSQWRCPECRAHLSAENKICLNLCHLSAASERRFQALMQEAVARVERRRHRAEQRERDQRTMTPLAFLAKYGEPHEDDPPEEQGDD